MNFRLTIRPEQQMIAASFALVTVATMVSLFQVSASAQLNVGSFPDVPSTHRSGVQIQTLKDWGIVNGDSDGLYHPERFINRAEFTKIVVGSMYAKEAREQCVKSIPGKLFTDVTDASLWFAEYLCVAKKFGVVNGHPDGSFRPTLTINFAEAAQIISKAYALEPLSPVVASDAWYEKGIAALSQRYWVPATLQKPEQTVTREEMAVLIYNVLTQEPVQPSAGLPTPPQYVGNGIPSTSARSFGNSSYRTLQPWNTLSYSTSSQSSTAGWTSSQLSFSSSSVVQLGSSSSSLQQASVSSSASSSGLVCRSWQPQAVDTNKDGTVTAYTAIADDGFSTSQYTQVFVYSKTENKTTAVTSVSAPSVPAFRADTPTVSADGRIIAMRAWMRSGLSPSLLLFNRTDNSYTNVPVLTGTGIALSNDGNLAVFQSQGCVLLYDRTTGKLKNLAGESSVCMDTVSASSADKDPVIFTRNVRAVDISGNGRYVAITGVNPQIVSVLPGTWYATYILDLSTSTVTTINVSTLFTRVFLNETGQFLAYRGVDPDGFVRAYVHDLIAGERISKEFLKTDSKIPYDLLGFTEKGDILLYASDADANLYSLRRGGEATALGEKLLGRKQAALSGNGQTFSFLVPGISFISNGQGGVISIADTRIAQKALSGGEKTVISQEFTCR